MRSRQRFQIVQRFFRFDRLHGAQNRIHGDDNQNDNGAFQFSGNCRDNSSNNQDNNQKIFELFEKNHPDWLLLFLCQLIFTELFPVLVCLCGTQTLSSGVIRRIQVVQGLLIGGFVCHGKTSFHLFLTAKKARLLLNKSTLHPLRLPFIQ